MAQYANIIVDISHEKLDKTFQYRIPERMRERLTPGMQVYLPFGSRKIKGYVVELTDEPEYDVTKLKDIIVNNVYDTLKKITGEDRDLYKGYTTGYSDLDKILTGLNRSDLILIGARPAMGKTSFALNLARNVAALGKRKVLFFSLEMTKEQLAQRVISTEARIKGIKMRNGNLDESEWMRLSTAAAALSEAPLYFDDTSTITVNEMKAKIRRMKNVDCVIIDYLQLIRSSGRAESRQQEVSEISRMLKELARNLNVPVLALSQLSRKNEDKGRQDNKPQLSDLRESGSIEQDADVVALIHRDGYYKRDDESLKRKATLIIAKQRNGPVGEIPLNFLMEYTLFTNPAPDPENMGPAEEGIMILPD